MDMVAAQQAMYYAGIADFDELERLCDACDKAVQDADLFGRVQWDSAFHLKIVELSRNELLLKYQNENYLRLQYMGITQFTKDQDSLQMVSLHREIVAAMRLHDENESVRQFIIIQLLFIISKTLNPIGLRPVLNEHCLKDKTVSVLQKCAISITLLEIAHFWYL